jgi:DNA-binding NarL/FixJ family response regulator
MEPIRVLIADDHPLVREGVRALLASVSDMAIVGEAANGEEAIARAAELQPDVILMDLHMPGINGIEATRQVLQISPHIEILVLTMLEDDDSVFAAMRAGARGYLLKGADQAEVLRAITAVTHGEAIFSPPIAQRLMQYFANMHPVLPSHAFPDLTEREREILSLIAVGRTNAEIAEEFVISSKLTL